MVADIEGKPRPLLREIEDATGAEIAPDLLGDHVRDRREGRLEAFVDVVMLAAVIVLFLLTMIAIAMPV